MNLYHKNPNINKNDLCASFQKAIIDMLITNTRQAIKNLKIDKVALAGGVSANIHIRNSFEKLAEEENLKVYYPERALCTDNAAMIASAGYYNFIKGNISDLTLNAVPNLKI